MCMCMRIIRIVALPVLPVAQRITYTQLCSAWAFFLVSRSPIARCVPASPLRLAICTSRSSGKDVKCSGQLRSATQLLRLPLTSTKTRGKLSSQPCGASSSRLQLSASASASTSSACRVRAETNQHSAGILEDERGTQSELIPPYCCRYSAQPCQLLPAAGLWQPPGALRASSRPVHSGDAVFCHLLDDDASSVKQPRTEKKNKPVFTVVDHDMLVLC